MNKKSLRKITYFIMLIVIMGTTACKGNNNTDNVQISSNRQVENQEDNKVDIQEESNEKTKTDKSMFRGSIYEERFKNLEYLKNNDYDLKKTNVEEIKDYILTSEYILGYLGVRDENGTYGGKAAGKVVRKWDGKVYTEIWHEYCGILNTMEEVTDLLGDYYTDKTIMYQLRREHFKVFNNKLAVIYASGEGANFFDKKSKVKIIKDEEMLKEVAIETFWDPGDGQAGDAIYTIELIDDKWKITNIKGFTVDDYIDDNNGIQFSFITWDKIYASSVLTEGGYDYNPYLVDDGAFDTAWVEGTAEDGIGEWIAFESDKEIFVSGIDIRNGYGKSSELFKKNNRVKKMEVQLSDGSIYTFDLKDDDWYQSFEFGRKIKTDNIKITILEVYEGTVYRDTCITEINVW
ncbi:NADase-type glycan-binding domain-containing protein [Oceanirhabdus sp. W0125-5]|uniref:NADase-type glycan-binding domain-containing protein n=1 Tax=Oceanirhabdus sp. W0125-5 TaxID=2999116 RepID=UPI0022F2EDC4|nr:DL-endopeptidase inhibitor IseA family protein [Oceanirhabdus sp. W0125-5]WBW96508.1 DL-endopeptidase inhibitor IseA family protein [Oceanirhabdus sp. W0125-5]